MRRFVAALSLAYGRPRNIDSIDAWTNPYTRMPMEGGSETTEIH